MSNREASTLPLLNKPPQDQKNLIQQAITQTFQSTAHLANLLPTGTVLAFQLLSPIFSNQGECDPASRAMTAVLIILCGISCFALSFSDSFRDENGNVCYGFATLKGLWIVDGSAKPPPDEAFKYKITVLDFVHAVLSVLVFGAIAMFDGNVVNCFYPEPSVEVGEVLSALPIGSGPFVVCCLLCFRRDAMGLASPFRLTKDLFVFLNMS